jgi:GAF domain-containing protein
MTHGAPNDRHTDLTTRGAELIELEHLRSRLHEVEAEKARLQSRIDELEARCQTVEAENDDYAVRYVQVANENEGLASLWVASCRLHSTLEPDEVTDIVSEILIELVGAEEFGILLADTRTNELTAVRVEGSVEHYPERVILGEGPIGIAVRDGGAAYDEQGAPGRPLAVVPLLIQGNPVGAIVITRMLKHRCGFDAVARELLGLLSGHAATALMSSRLYSATDRKLHTIEGFLELIKGQARAAHGASPRA